MKEEMILRILAQQLPNQSCGCKDMVKRSCGHLFVISGKWLGLIWNYFFKFQGSEYKTQDCGLILKKYRGLFAKWRGLFNF
jgi:hypothetical protein